MSKEIERSYLLVKPDGVIGEKEPLSDALKTIKSEGLSITCLKRVRMTEELLKLLYPHRFEDGTAEAAFRQCSIDYMTKADSLVIFVEGEGAIARMRKIKGKTWESGLRLKYAENFVYNTFHCPDTAEDYEREIVLLF